MLRRNHFFIFYSSNNNVFIRFNKYFIDRFISKFKFFNFFFINQFNIYSNLDLKKKLISINFKYLNLVNLGIFKSLFYFLRFSKPYKYLFYSKLESPLYINKK